MSKKTRVIGIIGIAMIMLIIILTLVRQERQLTFEQGFYELQDIDEQYNTSYRKEMLNGTMVPLDEIPLLIEDLKEFENSLNKKSNDVEVKALFLFTDIRKLMLTSQWYFQQGKALGDTGLVNDASGLSCKEAEQIIDGAFFFNESYIYGLYAEDEIDDLLYMYKYHPRVWNLVGIDKDRVDFFKSDLKHIKHIPINNLKSLEVYCGITGVKHETTYKPYIYERELIPKEVFE